MKLFLLSSLQTTGATIAEKLRLDGLSGRVLFLTTASEGEEGDISWLNEDRQPLVDAGLDVVDYTITNKSEEEIRSVLSEIGAICVAGGNTYYLLDQSRKTGFDKIIAEFVNKGLPYIGSSAGALIAGPTIQTTLDDSRVTPDLEDYTGFNLCSLSVRPHWGSEYFAERYKEEYLRLYNLKLPMILLSDNDYVEVDENGFKIFST
ncbi:Type 1 glutamine amidotransferase-like domain-containing protein [Candidatus Dojkabacteria bacterium]|uniref:Type 1 glutamine amidotransferase-like domain-containing protein n=1 Tax=Candidatus Dojkabacteria bacterium TaxID=2099670 RepID=A0A955RKW2_9BACT|nr:Type 1 glutamine amidotransferase-like domain-containing protein [Candidatus Dojkabacteria bacterium]